MSYIVETRVILGWSNWFDEILFWKN